MTSWLGYLWWAEFPAAAAGLAYLIARRQRCPQAARVGATGLAILLVYQITWLTPWPGPGWPMSAAERAGADRRAAMVIQLWLTTVVRTGCYLLLAWGAVIGRRPPVGPPAAEPWVPGSACDET